MKNIDYHIADKLDLYHYQSILHYKDNYLSCLYHHIYWAIYHTMYNKLSYWRMFCISNHKYHKHELLYQKSRHCNYIFFVYHYKFWNLKLNKMYIRILYPSRLSNCNHKLHKLNFHYQSILNHNYIFCRLN